MSLPEINFEHIRVFNDSRNLAFEELCSQLAFLDSTSGSTFYRKGRGADGGVECYKAMPDGFEIAWQAKYLFKWDANLASQLDKSIETALEKHPQLKEYIVCLPFDLPDSRRGKSKSALEKWAEWKEKWIAYAKNLERDLSISLWDKNQLIIRLSQDNPIYSGRVLYWFDKELMTANWFATKFERSKASLGKRYSPETNIELPIRQNIASMVRGIGLQKRIDYWLSKALEEGRSTIQSIRGLSSFESAEHHTNIIASGIKKLADLIGKRVIGANEDYPLDIWIREINECISVAKISLEWVFHLDDSEHKRGSYNDPKRWAEHRLYHLIGFFNDFVDELNSLRWQLSNSKALLVTGEAGIGKSHLLADVVEHQLHMGCPAILLLGSIFIDGDPWRQILQHLDRPTTEQVKDFLGALDASAQAKNVKALVCIDALNERNGMDIWPSHLAAFLKDFESFSFISVILSCRSTYTAYVIPDGLSSDQFLQIEHDGFSADGGAAAKNYLDKRGIIRLGAPNIAPEFNNPLFLKTCCDFLDKEDKKEWPRSLNGVSSIFEFYSKSIVNVLNKRMRLSPHFHIVEGAISGFAQLIFQTKNGFLSKKDSINFFESVLESNGSLDKSLLVQFESEGLITIEPVSTENNSIAEMVRFTFERFSDYAIASELLETNIQSNNVSASFQEKSVLFEVVLGEQNYKRGGIIEAMAVLLPERTSVEILDIGYKTYPWVVRNAFVESLLWREQSCFTDIAFDIAERILDDYEFKDLLISISTEPNNKFNAFYLHSNLISMSMPERDAFWSIYLAERGYDGPIEILISWVLSNGEQLIDEWRAELAATMLTWFLSTSNRAVRDKATKALACILSKRLNVAVKLLNNFSAVNDIYISERLLAACYGAVLQGDQNGLTELAQTVYDLIFKSVPPTDILLRDHAQGIIKYAGYRGALNNSIKLSKTKPPFKSSWPIEFVPDEVIELYVEDFGRGVFRDAIVGSAVNDGDFARYKIDYEVDDWSPALYGTKRLPTDKDVYWSWVEIFSFNATADQLELFLGYLEAASKIGNVATYQKTPETENLLHIESQLKSIMDISQWESFRVEAKDYIRFQLFSERSHDNIATFNRTWARRWVCKRAHDLGWSAEKFGDFDRQHGSHDRHNHVIERIGKKYQWIALRELLARMADNLAYIGNYGSRKPSKYLSARQINIRDIDPSLLAQETHYDGWREWERTWWSPADVNLRPMAPRERLSWLHSDEHILNDASLFNLKNPKTNQHWLALSGFSRWSAHGFNEIESEYQRETWYRINCFVVRRADESKAIDYIRTKILTDSSNLPKIDLYGEFYLGEYSWHPDLNEFEDWEVSEGRRDSMPVPVRATVATYTCERAGYDYSVNDTVSFEIPAPWMTRAMKLKMKSGKTPIYVDDMDSVVFYDPSISELGHSVGLVDYKSFVDMLEREKLAAIWVIAGEKNVYGGRDPSSGFGGCFLHTGIYQLTNKGFIKYFSSDWHHPSKSQLAKLLGEEVDD